MYSTENNKILIANFILGYISFGIESKFIREITKIRKIIKVHNAKPHILGISNFLGGIIPIIDLSIFFNLGKETIKEDSKLLIIDNNNETFGIVINEISSSNFIRKNKITAPPDNMDDFLKERINGVFENSDKLTLILDIEKLFKES